MEPLQARVLFILSAVSPFLWSPATHFCRPVLPSSPPSSLSLSPLTGKKAETDSYGEGVNSRPPSSTLARAGLLISRAASFEVYLCDESWELS